MKKIIPMVIIILITLNANAQVKNLPDNATFYDFLNGYKNMYPVDSLQAKHIKRMERVWAKKLAPNGDVGMAARAINQYAQNYTNQPSNYHPNWVELGPIADDNISRCINGQMHNIVFDPQYNGTTNKTLYACSANSGLWRSENDGQSWVNVHTDKLPVTSTSDLAISNNSTTIYIATGESDGGNVDYSSRAGNPNPVFSTGVYRSTDYGLNWEQINTGITGILDEGITIRNIEINPNNNNQLFIATSKGIFRTDNATDTDPVWTEVLTGLNSDFDTEFKGLEFKPNDSNTIYASGQDIYKSVDGGTTWVSMTGSATGLKLFNMPLYDGATSFSVERINITVTPAAPNRVYAYIVGTETYYQNNNLRYRERLYIYMFKNNTWQELYNYTGINQNAVDFSRMPIAVSPVNPEAVYFGYTKARVNFDITDASQNFNVIAPYMFGIYNPTHCDIHSLEFQPNVPNNPKLFMGSDGGLSVKEDPTTLSYSDWKSINNGIGATLIWSFDDTDNNENYILAGLQDNGSSKSNPGFNTNWDYVGNLGDGLGNQINDFNDRNAFFVNGRRLNNYNYITNSLFSESYNARKAANYSSDGVPQEIIDYRPYDHDGSFFKSWLTIDFEIKNDPKTGEMYWTFNEIFKRKKELPEIGIDNHNPDNLWSRVSNIRTFDAPQWRRQINRFEIAESNSNYRYIVRIGEYSFDGNFVPPLKSFIYKVEDGSSNYVQINRPGEDVEPFPLVSDIVVDPENPRRIWITYTSYNQDYKVWYSDNAGAVDSWVNFDPNHKLPNLPVNAIIYQKGSNDILYIATDAGVYVKNGPTANWEKYGDEIPNCWVQDLKINYCNNKLRVSTYGRGMWEGDILPFNKELPEIVFKAGENVTWEANVERGLRNSIRIKSGATLTIKSELSMPEKAKITVEPGGKLILDGCKLTQKCDKIWQGIQVQGNATLPATEANQGTLIIKNNATIEKAQYAVMVSNVFSTTATTTPSKAIIKIDNANFIDNVYGLYLRYLGPSGTSITNSNFTNTGFLESINLHPKSFATLDSSKSILFSKNTFSNTTALPQNVNQTDLPNYGKGIILLGSSAKILGNVFNNLYKGVASYKNDEIVVIHNNNFENNWNAVALKSTNNTQITKNVVKIYSSNNVGFENGASGLYLVDSRALFVEENQLFTSQTGNSSTGIYIEDCNTANQIYKNKFDNLYTAIFAKGNNRDYTGKKGIQFICNDFTANDTDILIARNSRVARLQGTRDTGAGNNFLPECASSFKEFNNQGGSSILYMRENLPIHDPACKFNVNVYTTGHNTCPSTIDNIDFSTSRISAISNNITQYKQLLQAITDGGNTAQTTQTVENATDTEALNLRNELLQKSPALSDSVMVKATKKETVLPPIMIKQVLVANPKAAKSDAVIKSLDNRTQKLPEYMRNEIDLGKYTFSYNEDLENNLLQNINLKEYLINRKIIELKKDSVNDNTAQIESLLVAQATNSIENQYKLIDYYIDNGQITNAQTTLQNMPQLFNFTPKEADDYNAISSFYQIEFALHNANSSWYDINNTQRQVLTTLSEGNSIAKTKAKAVLAQINPETFDLPIPAIEIGINSPKSSNNNFIQKRFVVNPINAINYTVLDYALGENENSKNVVFKIFDENNNFITKFIPKTKENQILIECPNWKDGIYSVKKEVNRSVVAEKSFVINKNGIIKTNFITCYPNPASTEFTLQYQVLDLKNSAITVTNVLGKTILSVQPKKNTNSLNINTSNWSKGVYFVNLLHHNKNVKTVKIILK